MFNVQVLARQQIELLTAQAWLTENKDLEQKVATTSYITLERLDFVHVFLTWLLF